MIVARRWILFFLILFTMSLAGVHAQTMRFDSYGIASAPENANLRIGEFYSDFAFFQSAGIRYMRSSGAGMDYLYDGKTPDTSFVPGQSSNYGKVNEDGLDFPLVSQLSARNYFLISKYLAIDASFAVTFRCFPLGTEDNTIDIEMVDPGFSAQMGSFSFGANKDAWQGAYDGRNAQGYTGSDSAGFSANLSADFELTPFIRGRVYERPSYRVDYVDAHGYKDSLSGQKYPVFENVLGTDLDWQMASDKGMSYTLTRTDGIPQDNSYDIDRSVIYYQLIEYRQQINPLTTVGARAQYHWRDYLDQRGAQFQQDYSTFLISDITEYSTVDATLGYSMGDLSETGTSAYETNGSSDAMIGGAGIRTRLTDTLSHGFHYDRSQRAGFIAGYELVDAFRYNILWSEPNFWTIGFSSAYESVSPRLANAAPYADWANQLSASRPLSQRLTLVMATAYILRMNDEPAPDGIGDGDLYLSNDYNTWATTAGLIQDLTERLKLYYYGEHLERISSNESLAGTRDTIGMTLGYYYDF